MIRMNGSRQAFQMPFCHVHVVIARMTGRRKGMNPVLFMRILLILGIVVFGIVAVAPVRSAFAEGTPALDQYAVDPKNRFEQVSLTAEMIEKVLKGLPAIERLNSERGIAFFELVRSETSAWDKSVAIARISKDFAERGENAARSAGFPSMADYDRAFWSVWIALFPDDVAKVGEQMATHAAGLKQADAMSRLLSWSSIESLERMISAAQQKPLPQNISVATPYQERFRKLMDEQKQQN
jgi:hypothetical protein